MNGEEEPPTTFSFLSLALHLYSTLQTRRSSITPTTTILTSPPATVPLTNSLSREHVPSRSLSRRPRPSLARRQHSPSPSPAQDVQARTQLSSSEQSHLPKTPSRTRSLTLPFVSRRSGPPAARNGSTCAPARPPDSAVPRGSPRSPRARSQCAECHAEQSDHPLAKTMEMAFLCKKCKKAFRKDMSVFEDADEFCPHCDNHFVRPSIRAVGRAGMRCMCGSGGRCRELMRRVRSGRRSWTPRRRRRCSR